MSSGPRMRTKNDLAWEKLFDKYNIQEKVNKDGFFKITSTQINEYREARLMTKFDHKSNLPQLFGESELSILPVTRGDYIIGQFDAYHKFEEPNNQVERFSFPNYIYSIDHENITSEASAINAAYISGIIADFTEEEKLLPTVSGRMSSGEFNFLVRNSVTGHLVPISVKNSQLEIDGGYEGLESLIIFEAKNSISKDFLIRQLYYPYRLWQSKLCKPVRPVFLTYSNGVFSLYEYEFKDLDNYNSLLLSRQKHYSIDSSHITMDDIMTVYRRVKRALEPENIPFPQADSFNRLINLCEVLYENGTLSRDEITYRYDFDLRQTNYYTDAGRYLGFIYKDNQGDSIQYYLTDRTKELFSSDIKDRNLSFAEAILEHKPFYLTFKLYLKLSKKPAKKCVVEIMKDSNLYNIRSDTTFNRRASTVVSWIDWIMGLTT